MCIKPGSLLLEDKRSTTRSEGHNQTTFSVFIALGFTKNFMSFELVVQFHSRRYILRVLYSQFMAMNKYLLFQN